MNLKIRKSELNDTLKLADLLTDAVKYKLDHKDSSWGSEAFSEREVRGLIKTGETYSVFSGDDLVATFGLHWEDERIWGQQPPNAGYIHRLAVRQDLHGQGLGKTIIDWVLAEVARHNRQYLRMDCDSANKKLCEYYEGLGFKEAGKKLIEPYKDYYATLYELELK
jgi:ribosomal protein S18 acetylase RimI-like enzyme